MHSKQLEELEDGLTFNGTLMSAVVFSIDDKAR